MRASEPLRTLARAGAVTVLAVVATLILTSGAPAGAVPDWPAYEGGPTHTSAYDGDSVITPALVAGLTPVWTFTETAGSLPDQPAPRFEASPTVVANRVYIGSRTGMFYALNATTGAVVWSKQLDYGSSAVCRPKGIIGTAAVSPDPVSGVPTVYAPGAHYLYALNAASGAQLWRAPIGPGTPEGEATYANLSSPTVVGGRIYMGLAEACDGHKIRGGVVQLNQHTGALVKTWYAVPPGVIGPSVWTSMAGDGTWVWVTTGNPDVSAGQVYDAFSIVRLRASTLAKKDKWTAPIPLEEDLDFGSSPTLFTATIGGSTVRMAGACNKNGIYYAWRRLNLGAGPVWQRQVGASGGPDGDGDCLASSVFDQAARRLYVAANPTTINGVAVRGSVRALDPATGAVIWEKGIGDCTPFGTPTLNSNTKVLAVPLFTCTTGVPAGVVLYNANTGVRLRKLETASGVFAQPVFASGRLFVADRGGVLQAYAP